MPATPTAYARALRSTVRDLAAFRACGVGLERVAVLLEVDPQIREFFARVDVPVDQKMTMLDGTFRDRIPAEARVLMRALLEHRAIRSLRATAEAAVAIADAEEGIARVTVTSAVPLSAGARTSIANALEESLCREVRATYAEDEGLIGGIRVVVDGVQEWDGSVAGRLHRIARHIHATV